MVVVKQNLPSRDVRKAAIAAAEAVDFAPGHRWRLVTTDGSTTSIADVPAIAMRLIMLYVFFANMFGRREMGLIDWNTMPDRVKIESKPKTDRQILAERTSDLLWANRHGLVVEGEIRTVEPSNTTTAIPLPGDIRLTIRSRRSGSRDEGAVEYEFTIRTGTVERTLEGDDALPLDRTWRAIICQSFLDAVEPGRTTLERRSDSNKEAGDALCRLIERYDPPLEKKTYYGKIDKYDYRKFDIPSEWHELPNGAVFCADNIGLWDSPGILVSDGRLGMFSVSVQDVRNARDRRATALVEHAIAHTPPPMAGASETGSAKAAILLRLLREALDRWPELADAAGTPIQPLLTSHLPRLMDAYMATRAEPGANLEEAEAALDTGLDRISAALDEALDVAREQSRDRRRDDLRVEVAFLLARHPERSLGPVPENQ